MPFLFCLPIIIKRKKKSNDAKKREAIAIQIKYKKILKSKTKIKSETKKIGKLSKNL